MNLSSIQKLNCEQVYNIWSTEPELVELLDLRDSVEYEIAHIPGAKNVCIENIKQLIDGLETKLAVIISNENDVEKIKKLIGPADNYVFMQDCKSWIAKGQPLFGKSIESTILNFKKNEGDIMSKGIIFYQLFEPETSTYTYLIADEKTKEAALIDPVLETVDRDLNLVEELGLRLMYVLDTHVHADHVTGAGEIRQRTKAKTAVSAESQVDCVDIPLEDGQELLLGDKKIRAIATPGHTDSCMTFAFENMIFTGDALLIRGCGRTDFQQGSSERLYESVHGKLYRLPDDTIIYPGHDYRGQTHSTIGLEKKFNARLALSKTKEEFKKTMSELKLANPKKIHEAVPANLMCGKPANSRVLHPQNVDGVPEVSVEDVFMNHKKLRLIDVRMESEFNNELGHIEGAELVTLGPALNDFLQTSDREQEIVFVCRSGARSANATLISMQMGYRKTANMTGGMIRWNEKNQPVVKD